MADTPERPNLLTVNPENIPRTLTDLPRWVVWRLGHRGNRWQKTPYNARRPERKALVNQPSTWSTFSQAYMAYQGDDSLDGIGFVLNGDGIAGLDLDHAVTSDGSYKPWAEEILERLPGAYVESSPSGMGLRAFFRGRLPAPGKQRAYGDGKIELYDTGRYLTVTGQAYQARHRLPRLDKEVMALHTDFFGIAVSKSRVVITTMTRGRGPELSPADQDVLQRLFRGRDGEVCERLWHGDFSDYGGDESRGDLRLANGLAFYCQKDASQIERIMRAGPYRARWDERRGDTTWLGHTIGKAIGGTTSIWTPGFEHPVGHDESSSAGEMAVETVPMDEAPPTTTSPYLHAHPDQCIQQVEQLQASNQRLSQQVNHLEQLRADDRARHQAERRLLCSKGFNANQKLVIIAVARIVASARSRELSEIVITRAEVAGQLGVHERTAGRHLAVFEKLGSPIYRWTTHTPQNQEDGSSWPRATVFYSLLNPDDTVAEILDKMTTLGAQLASSQNGRG